MFHVHNKNRLDPAYPPVTELSVYSQPKREQPATYLLAQACQRLWLGVIDDVSQQFTYVGHTIQPSAPSALARAEVTFPSRFRCRPKTGAKLSQQLHTSPLPVMHVPVGYC